jgi:hypothetical protein
MKFRLWPRREGDEPMAVEEKVPLEEPPPAPPEVPPREAALPAAPPNEVSLTIDEAKAAIKAANGDVIQIGFLASAYQRHREEDPAGAETVAARKRLAELVGQRLRDRDLLSPRGFFELRD